MPLKFNPRIRLDDDARRWYSQELLPVNPRRGGYLRCIDGDAGRFKRLLHETWKVLSLRARRRLLAHWRHYGPNIISPEIELTPGWAHQDGRDFAVCTHGGHTLRFWSRAVDIMPDAIVRILIAHELGHVYLAALGIKFERTAEDWTEYHEGGLGYVWDEEEEAVRDVLCCWGIDDDEIDKWADANRALLDKLKREWESFGQEPSTRNACTPIELTNREQSAASHSRRPLPLTTVAPIATSLGLVPSAGHNPAPILTVRGGTTKTA